MKKQAIAICALLLTGMKPFHGKPKYEIRYTITYTFENCSAPDVCTIEFRNLASKNLWGF